MEDIGVFATKRHKNWSDILAEIFRVPIGAFKVSLPSHLL
jgi:hypothetical protein